MKKFVLAYNPVSGDAMFKKKLDMLIMLFQERSCILIPYRTSLTNEDFCTVINGIKPDGIIIAGGDGTLNQVVNLVIKNKFDIPLAILPSGTSNDFASSLSLNFTGVAEYVDSIAAQKIIPVDVGCVGDKYFINVASAGMLTSVAHDVDRRLKMTFGKLAYYLRGIGELPKFRALDMTLETDGQKRQISAFFVLIVNSNVVAGLKNVSVKAKLNDGKLDLIMLKQCSLPELVAFTAETVAGKAVINNKNIEYIQAENIILNCDKQVESDIDGETGPILPMHIKSIKSAVNIYIK
ncbi:YegS/Rv2252/BmrU family lipid kinase [Pectinatus brassicae]|uniref:YegS/Rv2252/BmrU family lipid kinase n=1 Tax=Pectinatus brassicae TaxID=862415 RepID=A0A840UE18_9FIRM|nr:YegS/Rv2252/BmrU family lipid kinase [Pectinatus brassicae]MBB5335269.1 YegS/Rv2252/BmrU family lipid kinase [Pectinatus brassicae]